MAEIKQIDKFIWEIAKEGDMRVPGKVYADENQINDLRKETKERPDWNSLNQIKNVATLPGIQKYSLALTDFHIGYGSVIGGVMAFDMETGIITFGGVGFDINCLSGKTEILHELGYRKPIKEFEKDWIMESIKCVNPHEKVLDTEIIDFQLFKPKKSVFEVETETGEKITATADHPFLTKKGMIPLDKINGECISVYPFKGAKYEKPLDKTIVSEKQIKKIGLSQTSHLQTIKHLNKLNFLPLKMNDKRFAYLLKLMGYAWGDGSFYFSKKRSGIQFYGEEKDLLAIKRDLQKIGFNSTRIYSRKRKHKIKTKYGLVEFEREEKSIRASLKSFCVLMHLMGLPNGDKTKQDFVLPKWFFECKKWQKRLFLAAFFGAELSSPSTITNHGFNFNNHLLSMNKKTAFVKSGRKFLLQISNLLSEFGIESNLIKERAEYKNAKGEISIRLRLQILGNPQNLIKLWEQIGFEYNQKRSYLANAGIQYLKLKNKIINERKEAIKEIEKLRKKGLGAKKIFKKIKNKFEWINFRFVQRSAYEKRKTDPRIAFKFISFNEFLKENTNGLGQTGQIWTEIISKKQIPFNELVYDFTVANEHHNFIANNFVVSNCGVHDLILPLEKKDIEKQKEKLAEELFKKIPAGLGSEGKIRLNLNEIDEVLEKGARFAIEKGFGLKTDLEFLEENGCIEGANPSDVSIKAKQREGKQIGTLGSGNHYLEVQYIEEIFDEKIAKAFGLKENQIIVSIHCGSRGLGHQIGMDYLQELDKATKKYGIKIPDRELVCAPINSEEGKKYFSAVKGGINCAFANRETLAHLTREVFSSVFGLGEKEIKTFYGVGHNTAKIEKHKVDGKLKELLVQRKGSTRAFGPGREELPEKYKSAGQPVLVGGTMGTESYILAGTEKGMNETFGSGIHGAGRVMSRVQAIKQFRGENLVKELAQKGIIVQGHGWKGLAEEAPGAYKRIEEVVNVMHNVGLNKKVARLKPMVVVKG